MDSALESLKKISFSTGTSRALPYYANWRSGIKTQDDLDYALNLQAALKPLKDIDVRVEQPWISIYTNDFSHINLLASVNKDNVKYVSVPPNKTNLEKDTIIMPKMPYDYKITVGKTTTNHSAFIAWAESNAKVKVTKSCKKELEKDRSWGGAYFYVSGDNNLLLAKMHLGGSIAKIERIVKQ
jgi:hypothetical protein